MPHKKKPKKQPPVSKSIKGLPRLAFDIMMDAQCTWVDALGLLQPVDRKAAVRIMNSMQRLAMRVLTRKESSSTA